MLQVPENVRSSTEYNPFSFNAIIARTIMFWSWIFSLPLKRLEILKYMKFMLLRSSRNAYAKLNQLPPPLHYELVVENAKTPIVLDDGTKSNLSGYLFYPKITSSSGNTRFPAIMIRTPYGKDNFGKEWARAFAERGFMVLIQDTRGRFGSSGDFFPVKHEIRDGATTIEWLKNHPKCSGKVGAFGVSYLGLTSYAAVGGTSGPKQQCSAIVPIMASSRMYSILYNENGALAVDLVLRWLYIVLIVLKTKSPLEVLYKLIFTPELKEALQDHKTPLAHQDRKLFNSDLEFFQNAIVANDPKHEFWNDLDTLCDLTKPNHCIPTHTIGGWYDFFIKQSIRDWITARETERLNPDLKTVSILSVGPWSHWNVMSYVAPSLRIALDHFSRYLSDTVNDLEKSQINVFVLGRGDWLGFDHWPPNRSRMVSMYLLDKGGLTFDKENLDNDKEKIQFSEHHFNPFSPTPHLGGPSFDFMNSGRVEQSSLEGRDDVLTFTSRELEKAYCIVGDVTMDIYLSTTNQNMDIFCKLCDVEAYTKASYNLLETILRLSPKDWKNQQQDEVSKISINLGPIAANFRKGHCIRIQLSGGAHPLAIRHHGTEADACIETDLKPSTRQVFHCLKYPSQVYLPVLAEEDIQLSRL